ncbi:ribosomal RNA processing protein 36 homolog isoform X2 [Ananas comosus]|uniref:rRNA biogenesis protein RRP36 n=1 Tax=Ananas comosus TaxID=4615 RepID=A0A6P5H1T8_ANACO|nr:ribosomal RNA processing protein 36 homolog isoform X2 [Ananas comosus]
MGRKNKLTITNESDEEEKKQPSSEEEDSALMSEEELELENQLADIPFEDLQRARADGSLTALPGKQKLKQKTSRANKKRPMEVSSKVPTKRFREVIQVPKKVVRDPRFESLCGTLDNEGFRKRYDFLFEVELPAEKQDKQLKSVPRKNVESEILSEHIKKEREAAKHGKRPYYLKKSEIRERKLIKKYNELKEGGKLDAYIEKRRKKNASKDHRYVPYKRPSNGGQQ